MGGFVFVFEGPLGGLGVGFLPCFCAHGAAAVFLGIYADFEVGKFADPNGWCRIVK